MEQQHPILRVGLECRLIYGIVIDKPLIEELAIIPFIPGMDWGCVPKQLMQRACMSRLVVWFAQA